MVSANDFTRGISTIKAAEKYKVSANYITKLARRGAIKATKLERDWIIDEESLTKYLNAPRKRGPKGPHKKPGKASLPSEETD